MNALKSVINFLWGHKSLVLTALIIGLLFQLSHLSSRNKYLGATVQKQQKQFTEWIDSASKNHAKLQQQAVYLTQLTQEDKAVIDGVAHTHGVRPKDIKQHIEVASETHGTISAPVDSNHHFHTDDGHLVVTGTDSNNHINASYIYTDKAYLTSYTKPFKFLGLTMGIFGHKDYLDVSFDNEKTHIVGLTNIDLKSYVRPKHFGVGPQVGYSNINGQFRPYVGFGISYNLIRF